MRIKNELRGRMSDYAKGSASCEYVRNAVWNVVVVVVAVVVVVVVVVVIVVVVVVLVLVVVLVVLVLGVAAAVDTLVAVAVVVGGGNGGDVVRWCRLMSSLHNVCMWRGEGTSPAASHGSSRATLPSRARLRTK